MLALPQECRRNNNCAEVEKVAVNTNIPTYQFAIIKLAVELLMERKLEIKYQLALPFPGNFFLLESLFLCNCKFKINLYYSISSFRHQSRGFLLRQLWIINYYVKCSSNNLNNENINTGVSRGIII